MTTPTPGPLAMSPDPFAGFSLGDVEAVRLLLLGTSVIDWHRLAFRSEAEVNQFLSLQEFDLTLEDDKTRLEQLRQDAVEYAERYLDLTIPTDLHGTSVPELLLIASHRGKRQATACVVLKIMHVVHHLAGRELLAKLPVADVEIFHLVEDKVLSVIEEIKRAGLAVVEFAWSRKQREAQVLKLLAKRETLAAQVYDKIRFRLVCSTRDEVLRLLREFCQRLVPFNYLVPGQTENTLIQLSKVLEHFPRHSELQTGPTFEPQEVNLKNEFSGPSYRVINFVADLPVRVDRFVARTDDLYQQLGPIVFVLTEFQVMDQTVALENERGENSHERYKERQIAQVRNRLTKS